MSEESTTGRPSFIAPFKAAARQGSSEFAQALKAFPDSIGIVEEPGTLGNPTQQMVTEEMGTLRRYNEMLDRYADREAEHEGPEQGFER
jgi:hypothetical protein